MFEGLIGFAEETIFARINQILESEKATRARCAKVLYLLLAFADRNPGITRVLLGDALVGETGRAGAVLQRLIEVAPTPQAYAEAVKTWRSLGNGAEASRLLREGLARHPEASELRRLRPSS